MEESIKETDDTEGTTTKAEFFGELEQLNLERETLADNNQPKKTISVDDTKGTTVKEDFFKELERLGLPAWTWNTNLPSRVSFTEIADAPRPTPKEEFVKEI